MNNDNSFKLEKFIANAYFESEVCCECKEEFIRPSHFKDNGFDCSCGNWLCPSCVTFSMMFCGKCK